MAYLLIFCLRPRDFRCPLLDTTRSSSISSITCSITTFGIVFWGENAGLLDPALENIDGMYEG